MAESAAAEDGRCPGPSTREIILRDGDSPPAPLLEQAPAFLGDADIAFDRYTSPERFESEMRRLWPRVWQWACREEHIPDGGDFYVYDIGRQSYLLVRGHDGVIRAFVNSCLHRGMQLADPGSQGRGRQFLRCPFHGFSWHLDGRLRDVPCRWDFPHIEDDEFGLPQVKVDTWGGFVFINPDPDAGPLDAHLGTLKRHFEHWPLQNRYIQTHVAKVLPANWKMALEAFIEAYHVLATHSQAIGTTGDANAQYDVFDDNVTRFVHTVGYPSPHLEDHQKPDEARILEMLGGTVPPGTQLQPGDARRIAAQNARERLGRKYGVDLSGFSVSEMLDSIEYTLFPNMFVFPGISIPLVYRFRPLDIDHCLHEILFLAPLQDSGERPPPAQMVRLGVEDSFTDVPGFDPGLAVVFDQDTDNLRRQRDGAYAARKPGQTLGNYQESRIRRFHMTLDNWLAD